MLPSLLRYDRNPRAQHRSYGSGASVTRNVRRNSSVMERGERLDKTELTIKTYDYSAKNYAKNFMDLHLYKETLQYFSELITSASSVLDLACGPGNVEKFLLDRNPGLNIVGIDLSKEMIKLAKNNVPKAEFYVRDIRDLDFESERFDVIISSFCLPYLYDNEATEFINRISNVVKNKGHIYLSAMEGKGHDFEDASFTEGNKLFINYYNEEFLRDLFINNNLEVVKLFKQDYLEPDGSFTIDMIFILKKKSN